MQSDIMGDRVGPCFHCGIDHTPLWRVGPPEKPVLCNACGSRWRNRGTLDDYIPKHATNDTQSGQSSGLPAMGQPTMPINLDDLPLPEGAEFFGYGQSSASLDDETIANLCLKSPFASPENFDAMLNADETIEPPIWGSSNIPRRKRSVLPQRIQSPLERFHSQLHNAVQEPVFANQADTQDYDDVLIYAKNKYIPDNEIGLGCVMLEPTSPIANSKAKSVNKPQQHDPYGLACTFQLNPPSTYLLDSPSPTEDSKGKSVDIPEDDEFGLGCMLLNSPIPAADSKGKSLDITENESGLVSMLLKSPTLSPDSKAKSLATEDDVSCLVDVPIGLLSQGDTIMLNHVGLENFHFPNMNEKGEMHEKKFSPHHMTTRSRTSSDGGRKFFEDIYSYSPPCKAKDARKGKRPRGRPRKRTSQGPPGSTSETSRDFENPITSLFGNSSLGETLPTPSLGSGKSGEFLTKETKVEMLTNDVDNKLILDESGFMFTATLDKGLGALEDDEDSPASGN